MDYNKLTKTELIQLLNEMVPKEKFDNVQANLKTRDTAFAEVSQTKEVLQQQIRVLEEQGQQNIREIERKTNEYLQTQKSQFEELKSQFDYTSNILQKEYNLTMILLEKKKEDNDLFEKLVELYHDALFENKGEQQNLGGSK
jgi:ubiquinone/menaquinone biosynthesis C-methylase UbiE